MPFKFIVPIFQASKWRMESTSGGDRMLKKVTKNSLAILLLCSFIGTAAAQAYPTKTITIIVPFPPGGTTDVLARAVAQKLGPVLGHQSLLITSLALAQHWALDWLLNLLLMAIRFSWAPYITQSLPRFIKPCHTALKKTLRQSLLWH